MGVTMHGSYLPRAFLPYLVGQPRCCQTAATAPLPIRQPELWAPAASEDNQRPGDPFLAQLILDRDLPAVIPHLPHLDPQLA